MKSIQSRLASGLLISLIVLLLTQWIIVSKSIEKLSEQYISSKLVHTSDLLIAAVNIDPSGKPSLDEARIDPVFSKAFSGYYYIIKTAKQSFRSRSLWDETLPEVTPLKGTPVTTRRLGPQGQKLLVVVSQYTKQKQIILITVAEDITEISSDIRSLAMLHALVSLIILFVLISLQIIIVRRGLLPLDKISKDLVKLEQGQIQKLDEEVPREIHSLVHEINLRVAAFQQRLQRSRRATGNLAHALKRPLTLLHQLSQDAEHNIDINTKNALREYTQEIQSVIDRELKRSRLAGSGAGSGYTKIHQELVSLIELLRAMYRDKILDIELTSSDDCVTGMDREDFHELLGNILDNACKWARHRVLISYKCDDKLVITVQDDGPGIPATQRQQILERGARLDEQITGHGLGLAIVKDIIEQYQGELNLGESSNLGGLQMQISI